MLPNPSFLGLPVEMRLQIYEMLFCRKGGLVDLISMVVVCRTIQNDIQPIIDACKEFNEVFVKDTDMCTKAMELKEIALKSLIHAKFSLSHWKMLEAILSIEISSGGPSVSSSDLSTSPTSSVAINRHSKYILNIHNRLNYNNTNYTINHVINTLNIVESIPTIGFIVDIVSQYPECIELLAGIKLPDTRLLKEVVEETMSSRKVIENSHTLSSPHP